jgi:hypothetical protein
MKKYHHWFVGVASATLAVGLAAVLSGCGGGSGGSVAPAAGRTFYSRFNSVLVGSSNLIDVARGFVTLEQNRNVPVAVGIELTAKAVNELPLPVNFNDPTIFGINLPAESVYTPFSFVAISYWSAHDPRGTGDAPHFHPLFAINPPQLPTAACGSDPKPANCPDESRPVAAAEIPQDYVSGDSVPDAGIVIAPGIGLAYEDVVLPQPQLEHGWNSIGQNYFFYGGHMNGIGLGATNDYLIKQEQGRAPAVPDAVRTIKQPQVYPKAGYYPHHHDVIYDAQRKVHIFILTDFRPAQNVVNPVALRSAGR